MPEEEIQEQSAAPQAEPQQEVQAQQGPSEEEEREQEAKKAEEEAAAAAAAEEKERKHRRTATLLTVLLLLCLIAEVALGSYIGLALYQNVRQQRVYTAQYEAYLEQQAENRENPPRVQYIGPTVRVVDGVLVDSAAAAQAARAQAEGNIPGI